MSVTDRPPTTHFTAALATEWADPAPAAIEELIAMSSREGWHASLATVEASHPFFARRMRTIGLGNWHALLLRDPSGSALDVGCGFGSLALGLADYYRFAVGLDALNERVRYGALRARQDGRNASTFVRGTGLSLPFSDGSFDLVTLNGVLEWAGFHAQGDPCVLQRAMVSEAQRVLKPGGVATIAIENRFAMETLMGMHDTHTGVRLVPALPRALASLVMKWRKRAAFRTYLYSRTGYKQLMRSAGFAQSAVLDLVSSYNDYDFVVTPDDTATYRLLWQRNLVKTFYRRAGLARRLASRVAPALLGETGYAYLVLGGTAVRTVLDSAHPFWTEASSYGVQHGAYRFACNGSRPGTMVVVVHDGRRVTALVSLNGPEASERGADFTACLPAHLSAAFAASTSPFATWTTSGVTVCAFRAS